MGEEEKKRKKKKKRRRDFNFWEELPMNPKGCKVENSNMLERIRLTIVNNLLRFHSLEVQYLQDSSVVAAKQSPVVDLSETVGAHGLALCAEAGFDMALGAFTKYSAGVSLKKPDNDASVILGRKVGNPDMFERIRPTIGNNLMKYHSVLAMRETFGIKAPEKKGLTAKDRFHVS